MKMRRSNIRPTQPFLQLYAEGYKQETILKNGISLFYTTKITKTSECMIVPDGCVDFLFIFNKEGMRSLVWGTMLHARGVELHVGDEIFGVRFMPGYHPEMLESSIRDVVDVILPLDRMLADYDVLDRLEASKTFEERMSIFMEEHLKYKEEEEESFGKHTIVVSVKDMVCESDGKIKISKVVERTGYSARYINRVFMEEMGYPPKTFCKIIQFQRALEYLNDGAPGKMTDAAVDLGYYDQSQFIRDFKTYAGITPKQYLLMIQNA